jgi:hypothetical protein
MKRWKKLVLIAIVLIAISQIPFAYRRHKLARLLQDIEQLNSQHAANSTDSGFTEYKGVMHVHSFLGGHSTGTFEEMISAAQANNLAFVVMTEHPSKNYDTAAMTLKGTHGGVVFVNGNEVGTTNQDRFLALPGDERAAIAGSLSTPEFLSQQKREGAIKLVAYPQEFKSWQTQGYDGVEVYNLFTNARRVNPVVMFFDGLWSYRSYPELLFANFYERPAENLRLWDEALLASGRRLVATAGNDAHSNVGLSLIDSSGKTLLGLKLDPYERSFRLLRMHVLVSSDKALTADSLLAALGEGHCFIAFDLFADATGFSFSAGSGSERKIQGDEISLSGGTRLIASTPVSSRIALYKNGSVFQERNGVTRTEFEVMEKGIYRIEVYLPQLPQPLSGQPWIISNPIYVR